MSWLTDIARPEIAALQPYEHAVWEPGLVRLHANELPWRNDADEQPTALNRYPEPHPHELMNCLAEFYGVAHGMLLSGRGSDEAIDLLLRSYCRADQDAVLVTPPTFGMYGVAARIQGAKVIGVPLRRESGYALDVDALRAAVDASVKLVFVCAPNNPTGSLPERELLLQLARELEGRALLVVDEAYIEFAGRPSLADSVADHPSLVVLRTLSKAHALAGARCGALIAAAEIVSLLLRVIQPYAVPQPTIEVAMRALQPASWAATRERIAVVVAERTRLAAALQPLPGVLRVWPSSANFLLVEFEDPAAALQRAHAAGLLVRDFSGSRGLSQALRITIGTAEQNQRLIASLT